MDSISTFAEKNKISKQRVQQLIMQQKIVAKKVGHFWVILGNQINPSKILNPIRQRGNQGDIINSFKNVHECAEAVGCSEKNIYRVLNNPRAKAGGFFWTRKK